MGWVISEKLLKKFVREVRFNVYVTNIETNDDGKKRFFYTKEKGGVGIMFFLGTKGKFACRKGHLCHVFFLGRGGSVRLCSTCVGRVSFLCVA